MNKREQWFKEVDEICVEELGLSAEVLGEIYPWDEMYEWELSPSEAFEDLLVHSKLARAIRASRAEADAGGFEVRGLSISVGKDN